MFKAEHLRTQNSERRFSDKYHSKTGSWPTNFVHQTSVLAMIYIGRYWPILVTPLLCTFRVAIIHSEVGLNLICINLNLDKREYD